MSIDIPVCSSRGGSHRECRLLPGSALNRGIHAASFPVSPSACPATTYFRARRRARPCPCAPVRSEFFPPSRRPCANFSSDFESAGLDLAFSRPPCWPRWKRRLAQGDRGAFIGGGRGG